MFKQRLVLAEEPFIGLQGEGITTGLHSLFIRLSGCNLRCEACDSKFTWDVSKGKQYSFYELNRTITENEIRNVVFTGGEPLSTQNVNSLIDFIQYLGIKIDFISYEIETNGTAELNDYQLSVLKLYKVRLNISPKFNFKMENNFNFEIYRDKEINLMNQLNRYNINYIIKILFDSKEDLESIKQYIDKNNIDINKVFVQPKAIISSEVKNIVTSLYKEITEEYKFNLSFRTHILIFEDKKGV